MEADRYTTRHGLNPGGIAFSLGACGVLLFGLSLTAPHFTRAIDPILLVDPIAADPPPPPPKPEPKPESKIVDARLPTPAREPVDHTKIVVPTAPGDPIATHIDPPPLPPIIAGNGDGGMIIVPPHVPLIAQPRLDSRYIDGFQPNYPSDERLAGREGRVVVRVLIGTDGRVKQVEQVSAASSAFFEATRKRALEKWRFKPGTRDGVAIEAWQTMSVRFVLNEE
jgi:protein TonB